MTLTSTSIAVVAIVAALFGTAPAKADVLTYTFSGITSDNSSGVAAGQAVSASLSFDTGMALTSEFSYDVNGVLHHSGDTTAFLGPSIVTGVVSFADGAQFSMGGGVVPRSEVYRVINKSGSTDVDNFYALAAGASDAIGTSETVVRFVARDWQGSNPLIFGDPDAGMALTQPINWTTPGVESYGYFQFWDGGSQSMSWSYFSLDSFSVVVSAVPEPGTPTLMLAGLLGLGWMAQRRHGSTVWRK